MAGSGIVPTMHHRLFAISTCRSVSKVRASYLLLAFITSVVIKNLIVKAKAKDFKAKAKVFEAQARA